MSLYPIRNMRLPLWIRENKKLRTAFGLCTGFIIADLLLWILLVGPIGKGLHEGEAKYVELKKQRTEAILFEKQTKELAGLKRGIPTQRDMPLLVKDLVQNARQLHLAVASVNYDIPKRSGEELALLSFSLPIEGRYADIKRFIYQVETSDRFVGIEDMKFDSDKERVKLQMKLITYIKS